MKSRSFIAGLCLCLVFLISLPIMAQNAVVELWFSTSEENLMEKSKGKGASFTHGDVLACPLYPTFGPTRVACYNLDLLNKFNYNKEIENFGLDALDVLEWNRFPREKFPHLVAFSTEIHLNKNLKDPSDGDLLFNDGSFITNRQLIETWLMCAYPDNSFEELDLNGFRDFGLDAVDVIPLSKCPLQKGYFGENAANGFGKLFAVSFSTERDIVTYKGQILATAGDCLTADPSCSSFLAPFIIKNAKITIKHQKNQQEPFDAGLDGLFRLSANPDESPYFEETDSNCLLTQFFKDTGILNSIEQKKPASDEKAPPDLEPLDDGAANGDLLLDNPAKIILTNEMITQDLFAPNPWPGDRGLDAIDITIMTLEGPTPTPKPTRTPKPTPTPTMTPKPTHTPRPTPTPRPTRTPRPTSTPKPTLTPMPTMTPKPTFTPVPTPTPTMTPKPTPTPIPTTTPSPTPPPIIGPLWNFDLHNFTNSPVNDMEMILFDVNPKDIKEFYIGGWGPPFDKLIGTWLEWKSKYPLMPGEYSHFGISVDPIAQPDIMEVTWTRDGRPVNINYMPIHQWVADRDLVIHIIINPYYGTPRLIQRSWAVAPFSLPLDDMHRNNPALNKLPWEWEKPFILEPGGKSPELIIPNETNDPIFVRYDVMDSVVGPIADETIHGAFINQIIFGAGAAPILETLNNFDLLNNTKYPVNDLHIFLRKTEPQNIRNFYTGGWGKPYVMRKAIKLLWKGKEILPCNYVHFGLRIAAGVIQPTVRMIIWTYNGQPVGSIPFPWMKWDASRPGVVKSVITAPANPEIVTVDRRIAQGPFVPLKLLDKDSEPIQAMTWAHLRGDPVRVGRPGPILMDPFFDIFFDIAPNPRGVTGGPYFASLILDYTVRRSPDKETTPSLRMISEFDYKSGSTLFNFDVWNESDSPINDLELFLDGATTTSILYAAGDWGKIEDLIDGVVVSYDRSARWEPAKPADFNLALKGRAKPMLVQSVLTLDGKEVAPISIPWNMMSASLPRQFSSILRLPDSCSEPVVVKREYAFAKTPFLIEELNSLNPSIEMLSWEKVEEDPIKIHPHIPSDPLQLNIPTSAKAVLLRYSVWNFDGKHIANILTQAVLADDIGAHLFVSEQHTNIQIGAVPTLANGLILAFKEISCSDVLAAPQPFWFTGGLIRPASYIVWANPRGILPPGESAHFGLILAPQHDGNTVFARSLKTTFAGTPINEQPIPWPRFNMWDELEQAIIHNAPICLDEIWVSARFGRADVFLPIENLKPNDPLFEVINFITLEGEPEVEADIPVSGNNSSAFIQYDVNRIGGDKPVVIFTNEYATTPTINIPPQLSFILPANEEEITSGTYTIKWIDSDPDDDAEISLYFDEDDTGFDGTPIVTGLSEDDEENQYEWDTARLAEGIYYIYGIINDGVNPPVMVYAKGSIKITRVSDEDIADHILNRRVLAPERLKLADLNNDGKIDVADLICTFVKRK